MLRPEQARWGDPGDLGISIGQGLAPLTETQLERGHSITSCSLSP